MNQLTSPKPQNQPYKRVVSQLKKKGH